MQTLIRLLLWSSLIWVCTVCICHFVSHLGVRNFKRNNDIFQALSNEEKAKRLENELLSYQGEHNHSDQEVITFI